MFLLQTQKSRKARQVMPWLMSAPEALTNDPCSGTNQSVETMTLEGHIWKPGEYSTGISRYIPSWEHIYTFLFPLPLFLHRSLPLPFSLLSSKGPLCLCNLFPEPISSTAHFFYLCDFLNKLSLVKKKKRYGVYHNDTCSFWKV